MNEETKMVEQSVRAGFTLVEIIIAVSIVGIMAGVAAVNIPKMLNRARVTSTREIIAAADTATKTYQTDHSGKVPESQDAWVEALTGGDDPEIEGGPDALNDAWGNQLHYERVGKSGRFKITSDGPDGEPGTDDDLTNIATKK